MPKAVIHFDGSGKGSGGYVIEVDGQEFGAGFDFGNVTNNQAEYYALICALKKLLCIADPAETDVMVFGDSQLVVNQVNGKWRIKEKHLYAPAKEARDLLKKFRSYILEWKPRKKNKKADRYSRKHDSLENAFPWVAMKVKEQPDGVCLSFPFEAPLVLALKKKFKGAIWDAERKQWFIPHPAGDILDWINFLGARAIIIDCGNHC